MDRTFLGDEDFPALKNDLILRAARGEDVERVPVWIMRQAGRYLPEFREARKRNDFFTICRTPALACEVTLQPIDRFEGIIDASIIFSDILVLPQALGMEVQMLEGKGPHFPKPLKEPADIDALEFPVDVDAKLGYVFDAITLTRKALAGRVPLFGFTGAPWTLMAYMIEGGGSKTYSKAKAWLFRHPAASHRLLKILTQVCVDYLVAQIAAGAQLVQVFDSNAGELAPAEFAEFVLPYLRDVADGVRARLPPAVRARVPLVVFARNAHYALDALSRLDYDVVQVDFTIKPAVAVKEVSGRVVLQGNADPSLLYASPTAIRSAVEKMLDGFGTKRGYIANLGHGMYPDHNPEHLRAYLQAIYDVSTERNSKKRKTEVGQ